MKTNKRAILSSALILALSLSVIQPSYAQEDSDKLVEETTITEPEVENKQLSNLEDQANPDVAKTDSKENKEKKSNVSIEDENGDKGDKSSVSLNDKKEDENLSLMGLDYKKDENDVSLSGLDDINDEKEQDRIEDKSANADETMMLLADEPKSGKSEHFSINFEVPNRRVYDWVKETSTLYYNGKAVKIDHDFYTHANHREYIRISDYFELGKTYDFEIKYDKDNKTYAKGSLTLPDEIAPEEPHFRLVNLELSENVKRRVFDLSFYTLDKEGNLCLFDSVNDFYANGEKIGRTYNSVYNGFEGEVGKPYYAELRTLDSLGNELEYSGTFYMPDEGELLPQIRLYVVLTPSKDFQHYHVHSIDYGYEDQMTRMAKEILTVNKQFNSYKLNRNEFGRYSLMLDPIPSQGDEEHQFYKNREDAVKAAQAALRENKAFKSFEIKQDEDGNYYYVLSTNEEKLHKTKFRIGIAVPNRKNKDWIKPGSTLIIDGKSYNLDNYNEEVDISKELTLDLNKTYSVEIKDANGKTYATATFTTPEEFVDDGLDKSIKVNMKLSEKINKKKFAVMLRTRGKNGRLDFYPGEVYLFVDGKLVGKSNSDNQNSVMDFVGEAGKSYKAEIRDGLDYANSKLLATGTLSVPKEGELLDLSELDLILTPVGEGYNPGEDQEQKPGKDKEEKPDGSIKPDDVKENSKDTDKNKTDKNDTENKDQKDSNKDKTNEDDKKNPDKEDSIDDKTIPGINSKAYETQKEAEEAAEESLKRIKNKNSYTISKSDKDGKYYYHLESTEDKKSNGEPNKKEESDNESSNTKVKSSVKKSDSTGESKFKSTNVKTGVTGLSGLFAVVGAAAAGLFISKKNK